MNAYQYPAVTFSNGSYVIHPGSKGDYFRAYTFSRNYVGKYHTLGEALKALAFV